MSSEPSGAAAPTEEADAEALLLATEGLSGAAELQSPGRLLPRAAQKALALFAAAALIACAGALALGVAGAAFEKPAPSASRDLAAEQGKFLAPVAVAAAPQGKFLVKPAVGGGGGGGGGPAGCPPAGPLPSLWGEPVGPPLRIKVLSYNLYWWKLFDHGAPHSHVGQTQGNAATQLIADQGLWDPFDVMGFQECDDPGWLLDRTGLAGQYTIIQQRDVCMAFRNEGWTLLGQPGWHQVAVDKPGLYGPRVVQWMRLQSTWTGATVFVMNHHGPLPVNTGGACGGEAVAHHILQAVEANADPADAVVLIGDFNANPGGRTIQILEQILNRVFTGNMLGGIDNIFTNLAPSSAVWTGNLGHGGSDHEAISVVLQRDKLPFVNPFVQVRSLVQRYLHK